MTHHHRPPGPCPVHNLLCHCAGLARGDRLLIIAEEAQSQHYCPALAAQVQDGARAMGIDARIMTIPFSAEISTLPPGLLDALETVDCAIFFARLGDQLRFSGLGSGARIIVSYALDQGMFNSHFGQAHYGAFDALKSAIDRMFGQARHIRVTCPRGTNFEGPGDPALLAQATDVRIRRFPMSVFAPIPATAFSGQAVMTQFITGTCSRFYAPYAAPLAGSLTAHFTGNCLTGFSGDADDVRAAEDHYDTVAARFGIDRGYVHSWHAGIHPGCAYERPAAANYERWCSGAFGNPRLLHFHTCGAYAPGEISWNILDPTILVDDIPIWDRGRLHPERIPGGAEILADFPCAAMSFAHPNPAVGL